jgi:hypothetical protein
MIVGDLHRVSIPHPIMMGTNQVNEQCDNTMLHLCQAGVAAGQAPGEVHPDDGAEDHA